MRAMMWALVVTLGWCHPLGAETALEAGHRVLAELSSEERRASLLGERRLSVYVGRRRVGGVSLVTRLVGRALVLEDELELRIDGIGQARLRSQQTIDERGELVEAVLVSRAPRANGKLIERVMTLRREGAKYRWSRSSEGRREERTLDAVGATLALAPPLGFAARLGGFCPAPGRFAFAGIDLETGSRGRLRLSVDPLADHLFRGRVIKARGFQATEAAARFEGVSSESGALLSLALEDGRLRLVGGLTDEERFQALPDPVLPKAADPRAAVFEFLRALAKGDEPALRRSLDLEALYRASKARLRGAVSAAERALFESTLLSMLSDESWLAERRLSLNSGALELEELALERVGPEALVRLPGGGILRLREGGSGWRLVGFGAARAEPE